MCVFFFFNDTATTEIYTLSLHDALPICVHESVEISDEIRDAEAVGHPRFPVAALRWRDGAERRGEVVHDRLVGAAGVRSEEHTSELQSRQYLVCRLLLEKKKKIKDSTKDRLQILCKILNKKTNMNADD